jgi:hypothetical protein
LPPIFLIARHQIESPSASAQLLFWVFVPAQEFHSRVAILPRAVLRLGFSVHDFPLSPEIAGPVQRFLPARAKDFSRHPFLSAQEFSVRASFAAGISVLQPASPCRHVRSALGRSPVVRQVSRRGVSSRASRLPVEHNAGRVFQFDSPAAGFRVRRYPFSFTTARFFFVVATLASGSSSVGLNGEVSTVAINLNRSSLIMLGSTGIHNTVVNIVYDTVVNS